MPQFVLLYHECPSAIPRETHWDLMLEHGGVLRTWVLDDLQALLASQESHVEEIQPHRLDYLDRDGPLSDGRGNVSRIDYGELKPYEIGDERVCVELSGQILCGKLELTRSNRRTPWWRLNLIAADDVAE